MFDALARLAARLPASGAGARAAEQPQPAFERGLAELSAGRPDEALAAFGEALEACAAGEERARIENKRGVALVALRRLAHAREAFEAALAARPGCAPALVNLGNLLLEEGRTAEAIEFYERALAADADYAPAYFNFGIACKRSGRRAEAVRHFRTATRLEARADRSKR
jgi:tetratricopeptide (TPR) repeat protein